MANRTRQCLSCDVDISHRHANAQICRPCAVAGVKCKDLPEVKRVQQCELYDPDYCRPGQLTKGYCRKHYSRLYAAGKFGRRRRPDPFTRYTVTETGCWEFQGSKTPAGYPQMRIQERTVPAYRAYYQRFVGPIPEGLDLDHLCRNPPCVNPAHLEPVTRAENLRRGREARRTGLCRKQVHDMSLPGAWHQNCNGTRQCAGCMRDGDRKRYRAKRAARATAEGHATLVGS